MISIVLVLVSLYGLAWAQNILMYAILQFILGAADGGNTSYIIGIVHFVIFIQLNTGYRDSVSACGFANRCMCLYIIAHFSMQVTQLFLTLTKGIRNLVFFCMGIINRNILIKLLSS